MNRPEGNQEALVFLARKQWISRDVRRGFGEATLPHLCSSYTTALRFSVEKSLIDASTKSKQGLVQIGSGFFLNVERSKYMTRLA